jgi:hypothetical protein
VPAMQRKEFGFLGTVPDYSGKGSTSRFEPYQKVRERGNSYRQSNRIKIITSCVKEWR